jgi:hypothetical protein
MDFYNIIYQLKLHQIVPHFEDYKSQITKIFDEMLNPAKYCWCCGYLQFYQTQFNSYVPDDTLSDKELMDHFCECLNPTHHGLPYLCRMEENRFITIKYCEDYLGMDRDEIFDIIKPHLKNYPIKCSRLTTVFDKVKYIVTFMSLYRILVVIKIGTKTKINSLFSVNTDVYCINKLIDSDIEDVMHNENMTNFFVSEISNEVAEQYGGIDNTKDIIVSKIYKWKRAILYQYNLNFKTTGKIDTKIPELCIFLFGIQDQYFKERIMKLHYYFLLKYYHNQYSFANKIKLTMPLIRSNNNQKLMITL